MSYKLRTKLALTYGIIVLVTVGLIAVLSRDLVDKQFIKYVEGNNERKIDNTVHSLEHQYHISEGWDMNKILKIGSIALQDGIVLTVKDKTGTIIFDMPTYTGKTSKELLMPIEKIMKSRYRWWKGEVAARNISIHHGMQEVGTAIIQYYEPFYFTDSDMTFINALSEVLRIVMLISIIFATALGLLISSQISIPISNTIKLTKKISEGNLKDRVNIKSNMREIKELAEAANSLAEKLEEQDMIRKRIVHGRYFFKNS